MAKQYPKIKHLEKAFNKACKHLCLIRCVDSPCGLNSSRCNNECIDKEFWKEKLMREVEHER